MKYLEIIAVFAILSMAGCNLDQKVSQFEGDGTIRYIKRPAPLAADGVFLTFDTFGTSSNFNQTYSFSNLPRLDNEYVLYLAVESKERPRELDESRLSAQLVDSKGKTVFDVNENISSWTCTEPFGVNSVAYYYLVFGEHPKESSFHPVEQEKYKLSVSFTTNPRCTNLATKAFFCLKAGGFK